MEEKIIEVIEEENEIGIILDCENNEREITPHNEFINVNPIYDYNVLDNKPSINNVVLINNKTSQELRLQPEGDYPDESLTNMDIENLLRNFS